MWSVVEPDELGAIQVYTVSNVHENSVSAPVRAWSESLPVKVSRLFISSEVFTLVSSEVFTLVLSEVEFTLVSSEECVGSLVDFPAHLASTSCRL